MNAWELVAGWADERARKTREVAAEAARAYKTSPLADACNAYAITLGEAAAVIERDAKVFRNCAATEARRLASLNGGPADGQ